MSIAEQIKEFYSKKGELEIERLDEFLEEVNERATAQSFDSVFSATEYAFSDGSVIIHCSTNDEVRAYGCAQ